MKPNSSCCCGDAKQPPIRYPVTRPPCGRERLSGCGEPFLKTSFDAAWGKPVWLRELFKEFKGATSPMEPIHYEKIIRNGGIGEFNRDLADPAFEWDHKDPIAVWSTQRPDSDLFYIPNSNMAAIPEWPLSEKIAASEYDIGICDNPYYKLITHYPSVGRPFQNANENPNRAEGLAISAIPNDIIPGKQVEQYNYFPKTPQEIGNYKIKTISHDKNLHTNTAYPGKYWISWWNAINPGKVIDYAGIDIFKSTNLQNPSVKIKCDILDVDNPQSQCDRVACMGITLIDVNHYKKEILKVSSGEYHNCVLFTDGNCACWGLTLNSRTIVPTDLTNQGIVMDVNCGTDWTVATTTSGLTFWGNVTENLQKLPEEVKNVSNILKLTVGGNFCAALLKNGKISTWGSSSNKLERLRIIPRKCITQKKLTVNGIEYTLDKDEIIPFWGERQGLYSAVLEYENSTDQYGTQNDPISTELLFTDIWAGKQHIVGYTNTYFKLNVLDLKGLDQLYNFDLPPNGTVESRIFSWGYGMPGDSPSERNFNQCCPNYFAYDSVLKNTNQTYVPLNLVNKEYWEYVVIKYNDPFYGIQNTIPLFTSSTANHTIFARTKTINSELGLNTGWGANGTWNSDPPNCPPLPRDKCECLDQFGEPKPGTRQGVDCPYISGTIPCCDDVPEGACCRRASGFMFDGWGDDRHGQISDLGMRYYQTDYYNSPNSKFYKFDSTTINQPSSISGYSFRCSLGPDRTIIGLTKYPPLENRLISDVFYAGASETTRCIPAILDYYGGKNTKIDTLSCGLEHNIIVQNPDVNAVVDFPYKGEIDKGLKTSWRYTAADDEISDSPRIIMGSANGKNVWNQPEFDLDTASRLHFNVQVIIAKYRKQADGSYRRIQQLNFKNSKTPNQPNGTSVNLIGTRGDQRLKPFTGATCDCVWSDYATDSLKVGGHQGVILNHIGFDDRIDIRRTDKAYSWIEFNQLKGNGRGGAPEGGHEQPWVNFESAAEKAFNDSNFSFKNYWNWEDAPETKPRINYWYAPPNTFTHNIIELPPGRFPSELSFPCRNKYCYGGPNNVIQNWCDPCFKGITFPSSAITGWKGRLGCTGCEYNQNTIGCESCGFNKFGVWECGSAAPPLKEVYGYHCTAKVFGNILPNEIILNRTDKPEDDFISVINPSFKNQTIYQEEIIYKDGKPISEESWKIGDITNIKKRVMSFIPVETRNEKTKEKPIDPKKPIRFLMDGLVFILKPESYTYKNYDGDCEYYNKKLLKTNSFGELSTPIEEAWPALNRYFIPRWASLPGYGKSSSWSFLDDADKEMVVEGYTEIDYPLVVVPAHGGDIGPKYNMEGYVDTELFSISNIQNEMFRTPVAADSVFNRSGPFSVYSFMPGRGMSEFYKSRYIKDSIDFEYPFNKNIASAGATGTGHYIDFRPNFDKKLISFTVPPPGVFFDTRDIANTNFILNGRRVPEPICGDTEVGCSSCAIPFTGARVAAWGFDLYNEALVNAVENILSPHLSGDAITDIELGNLKIGSPKNGVWLGLAQDRTVSTSGKIVKRLRIMVPIDLKPGETIMFGRGVNINNESDTYVDDGTLYKVIVIGDFNQYPNDMGTNTTPEQKYQNYEYRWGRFNDECACDSRISSTDIFAADSTKPIINKLKNNPSQLTKEEKAKLIIGDVETEGKALVHYANCTNPITYLESGESPVLNVQGGTKRMIIGLSDISSIWPIWEKSMNGNGYNCNAQNVWIYHLGANGNDIIDPVRLYSGKGPDTATIYRYFPPARMCLPHSYPSGTGIRGFWSDWLSSRGYSTFLTNAEDKDRVGGDIPFEASHPQGWLGAGFVNPTDGYWSTQVGGDSIGDLVYPYWFNFSNPIEVKYDTEISGDAGPRNSDILLQCNPGNPYPTTSGTQWSSWSYWYYRITGSSSVYTNWKPEGEGSICQPVPYLRNGLPFPRTQNKKKQVLKMCCFGDKYMNEPPSSVTDAILPDRYSINVRKNKYRNLYNAMFRAIPGNATYPVFRDWHKDPFNPTDYESRLKEKLTPIWADYWWSWNYNISCSSQYDWFKNIQEWRHRRWDLPLFIGVNRDNIGTMFINDPEGYPENTPGLELTDSSYSLGNNINKLGWNHRKYDSITSQVRLSPGSLKWSTSIRGGQGTDGTVWPPRACGSNCWKTNAGAPAYPGTFYSMNNAIWYNCAASVNIPGGLIDPITGSIIDAFGVGFNVDYSRWQPYFSYIGPGFMPADNKYDAIITNSTWYT